MRFETQGKGEEGGGTSYTKASAKPYFNFPKCHLLCSLAQANLCEILTVSIESVIDSWVRISGQLFKHRLKRSCFMVFLESSGANKRNALDATSGVQSNLNIST